MFTALFLVFAFQAFALMLALHDQPLPVFLTVEED